MSIWRAIVDERAFCNVVQCTRCAFYWTTEQEHVRTFYSCMSCRATLVSEKATDLYPDAYDGDGLYDPEKDSDG